MNRTPTVLSAIALLGVIVLFILHFSSKPGAKTEAATTTKTTTPTAATGGAVKVAYIDIDTFEAHYENLKAKQEEFRKQKATMETELQRSASQMQADAADAQRKYQSGSLSETEAAATSKRLQQMQQTLETRSASMSSQFEEKLQAFNRELYNNMHDYLDEYSKEHGYDYVISTSRSNPVVLYGNGAYDITQEVIKGMNARAKDAREAPKAK
jgi:outer membrane protein